MDKYGGCCTGNEEVFLLCEKVQKGKSPNSLHLHLLMIVVTRNYLVVIMAFLWTRNLESIQVRSFKRLKKCLTWALSTKNLEQGNRAGSPGLCVLWLADVMPGVFSMNFKVWCRMRRTLYTLYIFPIYLLKQSFILYCRDIASWSIFFQVALFINQHINIQRIFLKFTGEHNSVLSRLVVTLDVMFI